MKSEWMVFAALNYQLDMELLISVLEKSSPHQWKRVNDSGENGDLMEYAKV